MTEGDCRWWARSARTNGSEFYGALLDHMADDADAFGPVANLLQPYDGRPWGEAYVLRLLGGVHRRVLAGTAPELARHYPSTGGDGDAAAAWPALRSLLRDPPADLLDAMTRPPQTNEVGRSASMVGGFLLLARETGLPLRALELGSSAGLNLRFDRYRYEEGDLGFGDPASPVRFRDLWGGRPPPFASGYEVVERRGCDRHPIDASQPDARIALLSFVWPDQSERFALLAAALDVARGFPVTIDRQEIPVWLEAMVAEPAPGVATVVFHSTVWQYLTGDERTAVVGTLDRAGEHARAEAPLAWLRLEAAPAAAHAELRLTTWPGGEERLLALAGFHVNPVQWLV
jgi:hypothetical protein